MAREQIAQVSLAQTFLSDFGGFDGRLQRRVEDLIDKLKRNPTSPGLNVESHKAAADARSRTARIDLSTRAILAAMGGHRYIVVKVLSHDDAERWMAGNHFSVNQLTGAAEVVDVTAIETLAALPPAGPVAEACALAGIPDKSLTQLGITDATVVAAARLMATADQVELLAGVLPPDQSAALTGLAMGMTVDEIYADLVAGLETDGTPRDPDDLAAAVHRPASRSAFLVLDDDQSLADVLSGNFAAWQVFLHDSSARRRARCRRATVLPVPAPPVTRAGPL
jgi:hypothetical protein